MKKRIDILPKKRKRTGKTNYKKRLRLLISRKPRLVIRKSLKLINAQLIEYSPEGDKVLVAANSKELEKLGWKFNKSNTSAAYLTGLLVGKKAKDKGIKEAILDIGFNSPKKGSKIFSCLKGAIDGGLNIPASKEIFPKEDRIKGNNIAKYAELLKKDENKYKERFSSHIKNNIDPTQISKIFEEIKNKIIKVKS